MAISIKGIIGKLIKGQEPGRLTGTGIWASSAGTTVTEDTAMRLSTVNACVRVLSEDVAALPLRLYRKTKDGGRERAEDHPLYRLLMERPNPEMTAISYRQALMVSLLLTGNAYSYIEYEVSGRIKALWPLNAGDITVGRDAKNGQLVYSCLGKALPREYIWPIVGMSYDGLIGLSPIAYARETIGMDLAAENYGGRFFKNGTHLSGIIQDPNRMDEDSYKRTLTSFREMFSGMEHAHGVALLEGGATYQSLGVNAKDAQFIESRKYNREQIASIFRVPPHMIGDLEHATFSNIEHQSIEYLQRSLLPWLKRIEQAVNSELLRAEEQGVFKAEHDTTDFLRGDTLSRMQAYTAAIQSGLMTLNEGRAKENRNPLPGLDVTLLPLNMMAMDKDGHVISTGGDIEDDDPEPPKPPKGGGRSWIPREQRADQGAPKVKDSIRNALKRAFSEWLSGQAKEILNIARDVLGENGTRWRGKPEVRASKEAEKLIQKINDFYAQMGEKLPDDILKQIRETTTEITDQVRRELGDEALRLDGQWIDGFMDRYSTQVGKRLNGANRDEVLRIISRADGQEDSNLLQMLDKRLGTWGDKRAGSMSSNELNFAMNEARIAAYRSCGYSSVWHTAAGCCEICQRLNGMEVMSLKPPLHKGCSCFVDRGARIDKMPDNDIIVLDGVSVPTNIRWTKQQEHIKGSKASTDRLKNGNNISVFYKDIDIRSLVYKHMGKGEFERRGQDHYPREYFDAGFEVGEAYDKIRDCIISLSRVCIVYSGVGWHAYPTPPKKSK